MNLDPRDPPFPISKPDSFSADLAEKIGLYRTLGWAESADKPLNEGRLDEAEFLYDSDRAMDDREKIILESLKRDDWDLFVAAIETTDRVSHMMWRLIDPRHPMYDEALAAKYGDSIEKVYRRADDFVGRLRQKLPRDVLFMVMSDHGFHSFRREVNLNTWLVQNGYMVVNGASGEKTLQDLFGRGKFFEGVDWSQTKAYAVGLGQIYFNLQGPRGEGHRLGRRGVPAAPGGDPGEAPPPHRPRDRRAGLRRRLPPRRHLQGRVPPDGARPAGRLPRRLPGGLAGHDSAPSAGRWSRTTTRSGRATTARRRPRSATASSSAAGGSRRRSRTSWTSRRRC